MERRFLRPREVRDITGLGLSTIYQLIEQGRLNAIHVGRAILIPMDDVSRMLGDKAIADPGVGA